jgi:GT2 family glycosyltransferase
VTADLKRGRVDKVALKLAQKIRGRIPYFFQLKVQKQPFLDPKQSFLAKSGHLFDEYLYTEQELTFQTADEPELSIVLILWNKCELTYMCLKSLLQLSSQSVPYELLIIDNASEDRTNVLLDRLVGVRIVKNSENVGFLKACNQARDIVKGKYLLFLNNDTEVYPGAIEAAMSTLKSDDSYGAVGARVILPNNTLQEGGNIMWNDGTCLGYARGLDPYAPEAMFLRETDYCSGAFLLTRTALFRQLGGFDERYLPAYYEETDFCISLRRLGYKIMYEPRAVINHFEFGSAEMSSRAMEWMGRNRIKFFDKHKEFLATHPAPHPNQLLHYRTPVKRKRLLYIEDRVPHTMLGAGFPRSNMIVNMMVQLGYDVTIYPTFEPPEAWSTVYSDIDRSVEVILNKFARSLPKFLEERKDYFDVIWVCRPHNMQTLLKSGFDLKTVKVVYDAEALFSERLKLEAKVRPVPAKDIHRAVKEEYDIANHVSHIVSVSEYEAGLFRKQAPKAAVSVLGHDYGVDPSDRGFSDRSGIVFFGSLHGMDSPNADSLFWFLDKILPLIQSRLGKEVKLSVVGHSYLKPKVFERYGDAVDLIGPVSNLKEVLSQFRLMVIPTRYAAGLPQKAFDAAKYGIPTVTTDLISNQMCWQHGAETLCSPVGDAEGFADNCVRLYQDQALWNSICASNMNYMKTMESNDPGVKASLAAVLVSSDQGVIAYRER